MHDVYKAMLDCLKQHKKSRYFTQLLLENSGVRGMCVDYVPALKYIYAYNTLTVKRIRKLLQFDGLYDECIKVGIAPGLFVIALAMELTSITNLTYDNMYVLYNVVCDYENESIQQSVFNEVSRDILKLLAPFYD